MHKNQTKCKGKSGNNINEYDEIFKKNSFNNNFVHTFSMQLIYEF